MNGPVKVHKWWLALVGVLLTPWVGAHMDSYLPVGWVLIQAAAEGPDVGFWIMAGVFLILGYLLWLLLLSVFAFLLSHRRRDRQS